MVRPQLENSHRSSITPQGQHQFPGQLWVGFPASKSSSALFCSYLVPLGQSASPRKAGPWAPGLGKDGLRWAGAVRRSLASPLGHPVLAFLRFYGMLGLVFLTDIEASLQKTGSLWCWTPWATTSISPGGT